MEMQGSTPLPSLSFSVFCMKTGQELGKHMVTHTGLHVQAACEYSTGCRGKKRMKGRARDYLSNSSWSHHASSSPHSPERHCGKVIRGGD
mmetsp:Transcript_12440/g.24161  ORF Transcript_12440/g.24161 Transcript_12440/m.24161 type:complete len:90 (+) Transcript_12440:1246-1515(+)